MPVYNQEKFIDVSLKSILNQTYQDYEVVIIDDNSSDSTFEILKYYRDNRIRLKRNSHNLGMVLNWNKTMALARGQFICMLHGDDFFREDYLASMVNAIETNPTVGLVFCAWTWIDTIQNTELNIIAYQTDRIVSSDEAIRILLNGNITVPAAVMIRKTILDQIGAFNSNLTYGPDWEMWLKICLQAPIYYICTPLIVYRTHPESVTAKLRSVPGKLVLEELLVLISIGTRLLRHKGFLKSISFLRIAITGLANRQYHRSFYFARKGKIMRFLVEITLSIILNPFIVQTRPVYRVISRAILKKYLTATDLQEFNVTITPMGL